MDAQKDSEATSTVSTTVIDYAAAQTVSVDDIPVIDIGPLIRGEDPQPVADKIMEAAINTGFFYIQNHGISDDIIEAATKRCTEFFQKPAREKAQVAVNTANRGWLGPGMATLKGAKTHDLKEMYFWGPGQWNERLESKREELELVADNVWPEEVMPELQPAIMTYYDQVCSVGHKVLSAIAIGLGAEPDFFKKRYTSPLGRGQLVYYPVSTAADEAEERFGSAPHTDFGVLTLLLQDMNGGLQVLTKDNQWVAAPPIPGTFVCNIGDLLHRWTNDKLSSNLHRVINRSGNERHSIPIFFDPDPDAIIDPRDFKLEEGETPRYQPVSVSDYIQSQNKKVFAQYQDKE